MGRGVSGLSGMEILFVVCAVIGGVLFFARLILQVIGADHNVDAGAGIDIANGDAGHVDTDASFKILTLQGLTAFFMMFGLVGLALYRQSGVGAFPSIAGGALMGLGTVWLLGKIMSSAKKLQSSGTVSMTGAIGSEGTVYTTIPAEGTGSVQIIVKNRLREFDAVSHSKKEIRTGEHIKVVWVNGNVLVVDKS